MPRVKHTAPVRPKKRRRAGEPFFDDVIPSRTPEEDESMSFHKQSTTRKFLNESKFRRYEELTQWRFLSERRVDLKPGDCDSFLMGVLRRNWKKLAEPMWRFDEEVVREFYANAWAERQDRSHRKTMVRGSGFLTVHNATISVCVAERKGSVTEKWQRHYACLAKVIRLQCLERKHASGGETCERYCKYG